MTDCMFDEIDCNPDLANLDTIDTGNMIVFTADPERIRHVYSLIKFVHINNKNRFGDNPIPIQFMTVDKLNDYFSLAENILEYENRIQHHHRRLILLSAFWLTVINYQFNPLYCNHLLARKGLCNNLKMWILYPEKLHF